MLTQTPSSDSPTELIPSIGADATPPGDGVAVLRAVADTAERERVRLEARAEHSRPVAVAAALGLRIRHLGSAQAADDGRRYLPAVWLVIAIIAVAFWFPGRNDDGAAPAVAAGPVPTTVALDGGATPTPTTPPPVASPSTTRLVFDSTGVPVPTTTPFRPPTTVARGPVGGSPPTTTAPTPVSVREFAWATSLNGASLTTIPEGTAPVANRIGTTDKVSYLRLDGTATTLELLEDPDGAAESLGAAAVKLCVVSDASWTAGGGQSLDSMPAWTDTCATGVEASDRWVFDLTGLGEPSAATGFALVPGDQAPAEFQVTFRVT